MLDCLPPLAGERQAPAKMCVSRSRAWGQINGCTERGDCFFSASLHQRGVAQSRVAPRIAVIEHNGPLSVLSADRYAFSSIHPSHMSSKHQSKAEKGMSWRKIRIAF